MLLPAMLLLAARPAGAQLEVVATIPDLADLARQIGGEDVAVRSIARGREDIHAVQIRPSDLIATSRADLFLQVGLSLEHAWVPSLLRTAKNRRIAPGTRGFMNVAEGWEPIQVPETLSRSQGVDLHPHGNPHFNLDPRGGRHMAARVFEALVRCDPDERPRYEQRYRAYLERLEAAEQRWASIAERLAGRELVMYHQSHDYLLAACGMELVATLEPKPGVPPTPSHLAGVIELMKQRGVKVVLTTTGRNNKTARITADKAGAVLLELPTMVGGSEKGQTWIDMMDHMHWRLLEAFGLPLDSD